MNDVLRQRALIPVLVFAGTVVAIISSLGAPLLSTMSNHFHVSLGTAQWSLTITVLVGAISAPVMGRLGDGPHRRETLIIGLALVTLGGVAAGLASTFALLVVGRGLQGVGLGLVPLTMATARDNLPSDRVHPTIALLSVSTAAGLGVGYPLSGLIVEGFGLSAAFWFGALVSAISLVSVVLIVPPSTATETPSLDFLGAALLTVGLVSLLLTIANGELWGWGSPAIVVLGGVAFIFVASWIYQQLHTRSPLVELRLLRHAAVLTSDVCATVLSVAMYLYLTAITEYVQAPKSSGYGFSASVVVAGLCLLPLSVASFAVSRILPWVRTRVPSRLIIPAGSILVGAAGAFFALWHGSLWEAFVMMGILGSGLGLTFAAMPGLIVRAVPERETGSVMGFYQVVRYVGLSLGSAFAAMIIAGHTQSSHHLPTESGYLLLLWLGAAVCVAASALTWLLNGDSPSGELSREGAELGPTAIVDIALE